MIEREPCEDCGGWGEIVCPACKHIAGDRQYRVLGLGDSPCIECDDDQMVSCGRCDGQGMVEVVRFPSEEARTDGEVVGSPPDGDVQLPEIGVIE